MSDIDLSLNQPVAVPCSCGADKLYSTGYLSMSQPNYKCKKCGKTFYLSPESKLHIVPLAEQGKGKIEYAP